MPKRKSDAEMIHVVLDGKYHAVMTSDSRGFLNGGSYGVEVLLMDGLVPNPEASGQKRLHIFVPSELHERYGKHRVARWWAVQEFLGRGSLQHDENNRKTVPQDFAFSDALVSTKELAENILQLFTQPGLQLPRGALLRLSHEGFEPVLKASEQQVNRAIQHLVSSHTLVDTDGVLHLPERTKGQLPAAAGQLGKPVRMLRVMFSSPGDIKEEVEVVRNTLNTWNEEHSEAEGVVLILKHWSQAFPQLGNRPQHLLNQQLTDQADLLLAVFWTRFGSHTGVMESGTQEEIMRFYEAGRPVMLYFANKPVTPEVLANPDNMAQYQKVLNFRKKVETERIGLYGSYSSVDSFKDQIAGHLRDHIRSLKTTNFTPVDEHADTRHVMDNLNALLKALRDCHSRYQSLSEVMVDRDNKLKLVLHQVVRAVSRQQAEMAEQLDPQVKNVLQQYINTFSALEGAVLNYGSVGYLEYWGDHHLQGMITYLSRLKASLA